ncbi:MAG TPA: DUF4157 domain-containing protein, partial [Thermoanaerobaculia bacterium]|nr:DUF4157 domain-containing protein [Thermoanaerobaculia bacterium]
MEHVRPDQDQADPQRGAATPGKAGAGGAGPQTSAVPGKADTGGGGGGGGDAAKGGGRSTKKPDANKPQQTAGAWEADDGLMNAFGVGDDADGEGAAGGGGQRAERKGGGHASPDHAAEHAGDPGGAHTDEHATHDHAADHETGAPGGSAPGGGGGSLAAGGRGGALAGGGGGGGGGAPVAGGALAGGGGGGGASTSSALAVDGGGGGGGPSTSSALGGGSASTSTASDGGQTNASAAGGGATTAPSTEPKVKPNTAAEARPDGDAGNGGGGGGDARGGGSADAGEGDGGGGGESTSDDSGDVQAKSSGMAGSSASVHRAAAQGISGSGGSMPYADQIQASFGHHDVGGVVAHTGSEAQAANQAMGAEAYATGNHVAFGSTPSLHTAAHEAAHVVQQRAGVHLKGGVGEAGDPYERHADAVADRVVAGQSATDLLDQASGGGGGGGAAVQHRPGSGGSTAISLDELRHAIDDNNAANALVGFRALSAADRRALAADRTLLIRLVRLLEPADGLTVLRDLRLTRAVALAVAAGARAADADFLGRVLQQLRLTTPAALAGAWNDLRANPAFVVPAVLMPVINAASVTAQQQAAFASTANGEAMTRALASGVSPLQSLLRLAGNPAVVRTTFTSRPSFARWLLETEAVLETLVVGSPDGAAWARAMWGTPHETILVQWIGRNPGYWGQILGEALLRPAGSDATRLRASAPLANAVFAAIGTVQGGNGVAAVLAALRFTLAEKIKAMSGASLLTAETLGLVLNAPGTTAAQQSTMTQDADAIRLIQNVSGGRLPHEVLTILAADTTAFCAAVARRNAFTTWVTATPSLLVQIIVAVPNYNKWVDCFRAL